MIGTAKENAPTTYGVWCQSAGYAALGVGVVKQKMLVAGPGAIFPPETLKTLGALADGVLVPSIQVDPRDPVPAIAEVRGSSEGPARWRAERRHHSGVKTTAPVGWAPPWCSGSGHLVPGGPTIRCREDAGHGASDLFSAGV